MCRYKNLRASIFCFAVRNYKFLNLAHTYWHVQSGFLHVALVLVVVLLETIVLVVLVFVLVLVVLLVLVGVVVALLVGWISVPRSHLVRLPRSHPDIIAIKLGFYSTVLVSVPRLHCKAALLSMKALFFLCPTMQIGLVQWIWNFEDSWVDSGMCDQKGGSHIIRMIKRWRMTSCDKQILRLVACAVALRSAVPN